MMIPRPKPQAQGSTSLTLCPAYSPGTESLYNTADLLSALCQVNVTVHGILGQVTSM